jgi:aconitate hydratase
MSLRSNIPEISKFVFQHIDPTFYNRAQKMGGGFILGGENYGQGSSREHAALAPKFLGVKSIIAKSFARIHLANLVNFGILPLTLSNKQDYDKIVQDDILKIEIGDFRERIIVENTTKKTKIDTDLKLSTREKAMLKIGGKLAAIRAKQINH